MNPSFRCPKLLPLCCTLLLLAGAWGCSGEGHDGPTYEAHVVHFSADDCQVELGTLAQLPSMMIPSPPERGTKATPPLQVLGDLRPALLADLPGRFSFSAAASAAPRMLTTALRRLDAGSGKAVRAEIFWRQGEQLQSLLAVDIAGGDTSWHDLQVEIPADAGELVFSHHFATAGLAEQRGEPVAWSRPVLAPTRKPAQTDVILLTIDTLRADALEHAPYLESLMNSGRHWLNAYSPSNWTLPAYGSLMTGLPPEEHGCGRGPFAPQATGVVENRSFRALGPAPTIAQAMHSAGYATCMLFQNPLLESWTGLNRGFERYIRTADRAAANSEVALQWWQGNQHRPRFLALHYMAPHLPYAPTTTPSALLPNPMAELDPEKFFALDHLPDERRQHFNLTAQERDLVRAWYYAEVAAMDLELRRLVEGLRQSSPDCLIMIHSDHGEELWDAGSFEHGHSFDDSVIRVPLAIVHPNQIAAEVISTPVSAFHLGTLMLEELGVANTLPASALSGAKHADTRIRSSFPLYRSPTGGRELQADGTWLDLPFRLEGSSGNPGLMDIETARRLAELGYSGD